MAAKLAKLADARSLLGITTTTSDALLSDLLARSSSIAERLVGVPDGALRRQVGIVDYSYDASCVESRYLRLSHRPIESVASIKQLYAPATDDDFDATAALVEDTDYWINRDADRIESFFTLWYFGTRCLRVTYAAGFVDPIRQQLGLTTATWAASTKALTQAWAFTNYGFATGDQLVITGGTGATAGTYTIASRVDANTITLTTSLAVGNLATGDITSETGPILPPQDLQHGVLYQAIRLWRTKDNSGVREFNLGQGGAYNNVAEIDVHPALVAACQSLRRWA